MHTKTEQGSNKIIEPAMYRQLVKVIQELYVGVSESRIGEDELANSTPLQLLEHVETILDVEQEKFMLYCKVDAQHAQKVAKNHNTERRKDDKEEKKILQQVLLLKQQELKQKKKAERESMMQLGGKKSAFRSTKPAVKKRDNGPV